MLVDSTSIEMPAPLVHHLDTFWKEVYMTGIKPDKTLAHEVIK